MTQTRIALLLTALLASTANLHGEVITDRPAYPNATPRDAPQALYMDGHWMIALYDDQTNLSLYRPDTNKAVPISTQSLPEVQNSYLNFSQSGDDLYLVWRPKIAAGDETGEKFIDFRTSPDQGKSFAEPLRLSVDGGAFAPAPLVHGGEGRLYLVWPDERIPKHYGIFFNRSVDGGKTWLETEMRLDSTHIEREPGDESAQFPPRGKQAYDPVIVAQGETIWVGWLETLNLDNVFKSRVSKDAGATWSAERVLPKFDDARVSGPRLFKLGDDLVLFFYSQDSGIVMMRSSDGGETWPKRDAIPGTQPSGSSRLDVAYNAKGSLCITWPGPTQLQGLKTDVFVTCSQDRGDTWHAEPIRLDAMDAPRRHFSLEPRIAMDEAGRTVVIWRESRNVRSDVYLNFSVDGGITWADQELRINTKPGSHVSTVPDLATNGENEFFITWLEAESDQSATPYHLAFESVKLPEKPSESIQFAFRKSDEYVMDTPPVLQNTQARKKRLLERANELWSSYVSRDYETIHELMDPFYRAKVNKLDTLANFSKVTYKSYEILEDSVKLEGNQATFQMKVAFQVDNVRAGSQVVNIPETETEITDTWIWVDNDWYRLFLTAKNQSFLPL